MKGEGMKKSTVLGLVSAVILTSVFSCALAATFTKFSNKFIKIFKTVINMRKQ